MEVSVRKKDYDERLSRIANSTILKLLSNTRFFAEGVQKTKRKDDPNRWDWEKRRELLFDLSDDMPTDDDIIQANPALSRMPEILNGKSAEKRKAVIKERQTGLNKLIHEIPISIKERKRDIPDISGLDLPTIEKALSELSKALTEKNEEAARIESGGEIAEKIKKQRGIESRLLEIENKISAARNWAEAERRKKVSEFETVQRKKLSGLEATLENEKIARDRTLKAINNRAADNRVAEQEMAKLRLDWDDINEAVFDESSTVCPTCGQEYPENQADEIREAFHMEKAKELDRINQTGRGIGNEVTERNNQNKTDQANISLYEKKIEEITGQINKIKEQTPEKEEDKPAEKDKEQEALELDLTELKLNIEGLRANSHEATEKVKAEIEVITEKQTAENLKKQTLESYEKDQARIKELGEQQRLCSKEFEELEEQTFILNEFTKTKAAMVEGKISEKFTITEFKLFNLQVNGEVDDCCRVKHQGICWDAGLNHASTVNVGVDICNTLSKHFGLTMPLFLDDMNLVTKLIPTDSQIIRLVVDEKYDSLTVVEDK
jgi:DNA repair exonuclease SbcCD ATPase subunit